MKPRDISKSFSEQKVDRATSKSVRNDKRMIMLKIKEKLKRDRIEVSEENFNKLRGR